MSNLTLSNVTYQYRTATAPAVENVNCGFLPGTMYAVVGQVNPAFPAGRARRAD